MMTNHKKTLLLLTTNILKLLTIRADIINNEDDCESIERDCEENSSTTQ